MNTQPILSYLAELNANNNREWYHAHKRDYDEATACFHELLQGLVMEIAKFDNSILRCDPKELTFKLVRDTRFSKDKSPYNPAFRAHISACGKLPVPVGYYVMLRPGDRSFLGGGLFADMFANATAKVRDGISACPEEWERIVTHPDFLRYFTVKGTALKNVPQGYDKGHPQAEYLKYKSWYLEYPVTDAELLEGDFLQRAVEVCRAMKPFNDFLNRALAGFTMPQR